MPDDYNDIRYYRNIGSLCDNWVAEFDFEATGPHTDPSLNRFSGYLPFVLTEKDENPIAITFNLNPIDNYLSEVL